MKIITSNSAHDAYFRVLEDMKAALRAGDKLRVIAPDRFTASVERGLLLTLKEQGSFDIEVMSFSRMAERYVGADIKKCLTPEGSVMLIGKVIDDCQKKGQLSYYGKAAGKEGFASELYAALTAIRNSGVSSSKLEEAANRCSSRALKRKLSDIVAIYKGYLQALEQKRSDSTTRLEQLAKYIRENPSDFVGTHFFCTDINEFSQPEYDILQGLAQSAGSLTIGIESGEGNPNARIYPNRVIKKLCGLSKDRLELVSYKDETMPPCMSAISERLFSYRPATERVETDGLIRIRRAKDRGDEVLRLALDILKEVGEGGRYKNFEVYASNIAEYENEIKSVFARYGIPFFIDRKSLLVEQTKTRYLLDAIACVRSGFQRRECVDFVKNPLFEAQLENGMDAAFEFENHMLEHNLERCPKNSVFLPNSVKRQFIDQKTDFNATDWRQYTPERVREKLFEALAPFENLASAGKKPIAQFAEACKSFLSACDAYSAQYVQKLSELSAYYVKCAEQVDRKLAAVLDEIEDVLDDDSDIAGFEGILKGMLKTLKISLVPTYLDCVFVGDGDSRFMGDGKIYALGATNDAFPCITAGGAVLTARDEELLDKLDVPIIPASLDKAYMEMFKILDLIKKPRKGVVLSYPESGGTGLCRRSTVIDELLGLLSEGGEPIKIENVDFSNADALCEEDKLNLLFSEKAAGYVAISSFGRAGADPVLGTAYECMAQSDKRRINPRALPVRRINMPKGAGVEKISVSRLETFFACPYRHFMKYTLSLKPRREGKLQTTDNGNILHAMLESFFKDVRDGKLTDASQIEEATERYFLSAIEKLRLDDFLQNPKTGRLLLRVKAEGAEVCAKLYEIYLRSEFKPIFLEQRIENFADVELVSGDRRFKLSGVIDRVDALDDKFIVIDYKTYKSADLKTSDVYFGKRLQLYIYMSAIEQGLKKRPVGVFYLPIYSKYSGDGVNRYEYKGHASNDDDVLAQIDSAFGSAQSIVPISKKRGVLDPNKFLSESQFETLGNYAKELAGAGAREIEKGYIMPAPIEECSDYCDYYDICSFKGACGVRGGKEPPIELFLAKRDEPAQNDAAENHAGSAQGGDKKDGGNEK